MNIKRKSVFKFKFGWYGRHVGCQVTGNIFWSLFEWVSEVARLQGKAIFWCEINFQNIVIIVLYPFSFKLIMIWWHKCLAILHYPSKDLSDMTCILWWLWDAEGQTSRGKGHNMIKYFSISIKCADQRLPFPISWFNQTRFFKQYKLREAHTENRSGKSRISWLNYLESIV